MSSIKPKISVVICTYNRADKVARCLQALQEQTLSTSEYEVIVVNDGSTDKTAHVLENYSFKIITNKPNQGMGQSHNNGVAVSKADIIAFTDDDCVADKNWLKNLLEDYSDTKVIAVGGKIIPYKTDKWLLRYYEENNPLAHLTFAFDNSSGIFYSIHQYVKHSFSLRQLPDEAVGLYMLVGANMSMRRSIFGLVGGFDPIMRFGGEEEDFWNRLRKLKPNEKLLYAPGALIKHDYEPYFKDALRRNYSYGIGSARKFLKDGGLPVLYPFPVLVIVSLGLALISPYYLLICPFLITVLYPGWLLLAVRKKQPSYTLYAGVQMILELVNSCGFIRGYLKFKFLNSSGVEAR